jgi:hypothetical protein
VVEPLHALAGRLSDLARAVAQIGRSGAAPAAWVREPCASCGEETAVGSPFFSDRLKIARYGRAGAFVCGLCNAQIRESHMPPRWTDKDVATFTRNASAAAITWWSHF